MSSSQYARSEASFKAFAEELGLKDLILKFVAKGWASFNDLAFSTPDPAKRIEQFEEQVIPALIDVKVDAQAKLVPRQRQLHAKAFAVSAAALAEPPAATEQKVHMPPAERQEKMGELKKAINGFDLAGQNAPSTALIDRMVSIVSKSHVLYVGWERCTSREQECSKKSR